MRLSLARLPHPTVLMLAVVLFAVVIGGVLRVVFYSWTLPHCWRCGSVVRRSLYVSPAANVLKFLFLVPYRCKSCLCRFYGFRGGVFRSGPSDDFVPTAGNVISVEPRSRVNRP